MIHKKIKVLIGTIALTSLVYAQQPPQGTPGPGAFWRQGGNFGGPGAPNIFGTAGGNNNPIYTYTNGTQRMIVNGDGTFANGTNTSGFIGIGTNNPFSPLHVVGSQAATSLGWRRGITLSNNATLQWDGGGGGGFFMAHPSGTPNGNWYAGQNANRTPTSPVDYAFSVYVNDNLGTVNPLRSTQFFKNILVHQDNYSRRFGVNTLNPQRSAEIYGNTTQMRLSYGATNSTVNAPTVFTDFQTNPNGNLLIRPTGQRMGVNLNANPSHNLDVNGNARVRNVPIAGAPQSLIIGQQVGGGNDRELQRLDFTGNANEVLLGNGTWGPATPNVIGNNGIFINNGEVQLGAPCNSFLPLIFSRFTESRAVWLNGNSFWMYSSAAQTGGVGFGAQPASAGLCGVGNTVEISANNQSVYGNTNASGLRFTKLTSLSPTIANGVNGVDNSKILTVDQNGDVVLTEGGSPNIFANNGTSLDPTATVPTVQFGQEYLGAPAFSGIGELLNDREVPLLKRDLHFTGIGSPGNDLISIGQPVQPSYQTGKLHVWNDTEENGILSISNHNFQTANFYSAVKGQIEDFQGDKSSGVRGVARSNQNPPTALGHGVWGESYGNSVNIGVRGDGIAINGTNTNYGGFFYTAGQANRNRAIRAHALNSNFVSTAIWATGSGGGNFTYGLRADASSGSGAVYAVYGEAYNGNPNNYAGYFNGNFVQTGGTFTPSDVNLKINIDSVSTGGLNFIDQLNPVIYEYADYSQTNNLNLPIGQQLGFIAQEVEQILPNAVKDIVHPDLIDSAGNVTAPGMTYKAINYDQIIPIAIQGIKELNAKVDSLDNSNLIDSLVQVVDSLNTTVSNQQNQITDLENENATQQNQIDDLTNRLDQLENCLGNLLPILCQINNAAINQNDGATQKQLMQTMSLELNDGENIVLEQNVPNPFNEQTVINYFIPESIGSASIVFYNRDGKLIKQQDITTRGNGRINVYGYDLSSGLYTYSLIADGQIVATKKMVKVN